MSKPSITDSAATFSENHKSETMGTGTDACRCTVIIQHHDTLGSHRILPEGILVVVYDEAGNTYPSKIDQSGFSRHEQVRCGEISWQLKKSTGMENLKEAYDKSGIKRKLGVDDESFQFDKSDGYLLVQANDVKAKDPRKQFAEPLKVFASYGSEGVANIEAIYLPPPMLLNLRFNQKINKSEYEKNKERIKDQIYAAGKNVTLFIHGFNVDLGKTGTLLTSQDLGGVPSYDSLPRSSELFQAPYIYCGDVIGEIVKTRLETQKTALYNENMKELIKGKKGKINGNPVMFSVDGAYSDMDKKIHGEDSLSWFPSVEYFLNLAASGKLSPSEPFTDWDKYSRILGVSWSGNISLPNIFFRAEMYANETGRELAEFLKELIDKEYQINIVTHSLGARVALSALNILGDGLYNTKKIDNLIMLEAAVADNAITGNYTRDKNPLAMELFPFAHKVVNSIRVMYSQEDGVLGEDGSRMDFDDGLISDGVRGTYLMKYGFFANRNNAMSDYYPRNTDVARQHQKAQIHNAIQLQCRDNMGMFDEKVAALCNYMKGKPLYHRQVIEDEVKKVVEKEMKAVNSNDQTSLSILRPWSHFRRFPEDADYTKHIIDVLMNVIFRPDWKLSSEELEIRPALGYIGEMLTAPEPKQKIDKELSKKYPQDKFIFDLKKKQFFYYDQSAYFSSHSAIKDLIWEEMTKTKEQRNKHKPTRFYRIYQESYKEQIMDKYIKEKSKFGRYK